MTGTALVTGASGYVGGRLVPQLLAAGWSVRAVARKASRLRDYPWTNSVDVIEGDVLDTESLRAALEGIDVAYYLVHAIGSASAFEATDRRAAENFAKAARAAGVGRIAYLGGMIPEAEVLSPHLRSRAEVGTILLDSGVPTVVLQAAVVLGSGSASFEMLRHLTERLPVMVTPRWVDVQIQPIAIRDVLRYLVGVADLPAGVNRSFDIGGADVLTYRDMMQACARVAGLPRRRIVGPGAESDAVGALGRVDHPGAEQAGQAAGGEPAQHRGGQRARHRPIRR